MIHSMTAFARTQKQILTGNLCWEIRSVNHRYLDVSFRMPESLRYLESQLRSAFRDKIHRGKLECNLKYQETSQDKQTIIINKDMINSLINISQDISSNYPVANDFSMSHLLSWPGVIGVNPVDTEALSEETIELFVETLNQLRQARALEGKALKSHVLERLDALQTEVNKARAIISKQAPQSKEKLLNRLKAVAMEVPEARVEQEIALILTRLDVTEELDRLTTHIGEVNRSLNSDIVAGRRLDFLMQELNREANTLGSKSDTVELTQVAVEMKVLIEQMREQIQNIE